MGARRAWRVGGHAVEEFGGVGVDDEGVGGRDAEELLFFHVVEKGDEGVVEVVDVEEADGVVVDGELGPGEDLEEFVEGADAAGEGDEAAGDVGHHLFTLVHGVYDAEFVDAGVAEFFVHELPGDDAGDAAASASVEDGVGEVAHEPGAAAAVDEGDVTVGHFGAEGAGGGGVGGASAGGCAAVDAEGGEGAGSVGLERHGNAG